MVVVPGMDTTDIFWQNRIYFSIATHIIVVAGLTKAGNACCNEAIDSKGLVAATAGTMDNDEFHVLMFEMFQWLVHHTFVF